MKCAYCGSVTTVQSAHKIPGDNNLYCSGDCAKSADYEGPKYRMAHENNASSDSIFSGHYDDTTPLPAKSDGFESFSMSHWKDENSTPPKNDDFESFSMSHWKD